MRRKLPNARDGAKICEESGLGLGNQEVDTARVVTEILRLTLEELQRCFAQVGFDGRSQPFHDENLKLNQGDQHPDERCCFGVVLDHPGMRLENDQALVTTVDFGDETCSGLEQEACRHECSETIKATICARMKLTRGFPKGNSSPSRRSRARQSSSALEVWSGSGCTTLQRAAQSPLFRARLRQRLENYVIMTFDGEWSMTCAEDVEGDRG